jgi:mRNA interferase MazF
MAKNTYQKTEQLFDEWNGFKKKREFAPPKKQFFHTGEIWWCATGVNMGSEIDGKNNYFERPVLVLKKCNDRLFLGVPLTSRSKNGSFFVPIKYNRKSGNAVIAQTRAMSAKRLLRNMCKMPKKELLKVKRAYTEFIQ